MSVVASSLAKGLRSGHQRSEAWGEQGREEGLLGSKWPTLSACSPGHTLCCPQF